VFTHWVTDDLPGSPTRNPKTKRRIQMFDFLQFFLAFFAMQASAPHEPVVIILD